MGNLTIELPSILDIPEKLMEFIVRFNEFLNFLIEGGRCSAKSQSIARFILYLCDQKKLRVVCGRETQNSIEESVYTIFKDLIIENNLAFDILATEIRSRRTGAKINFRGFREQGKQNIKGLEGVDILWVDEAQSITKETLEIIVPTIRKANSRIFWSMNRFTEDDAVFNEFFGRKDTLHIHCDYLDNKHCPEKMIVEAEICKARNIEDYNHIWLGQPRKNGGVITCVSRSMYEELRGITIHRPIAKRLLTCDPALGGDECVAYIINENGKKLDELFLHERDEMKVAGLLVAFANKNKTRDFVIGTIGFKGIAHSIKELMRCNMIEFCESEASCRPDDYLNLRAEAYMYTADEIINHRVEYFDDEVMIKQLVNIRIKPITSRKLRIEDKTDIRKRLLTSSDRSDAYTMGIWALPKCKPLSYWRENENKKDSYSGEEGAGEILSPMCA